MSILDMTAK